jgi:transcriptional regulator with XRE-family HTH domain
MPMVFSGKLLRKHREETGLNIDELAVAAGNGLRSTSIRGYELGYRAPRVVTLCRIAEVLGCDVADFFTTNDESGSSVRVP